MTTRITSGILLHVRHLETVGWERLMWGEPRNGQLGSLPRLVELLLTESSDQSVTAIVLGCGPSHKHGLSESAYTKNFLLKRFDRLAEFDRISAHWHKLSAAEKSRLFSRLENIVETPEIKNTEDEIIKAARIFASRGVTKITQLASVSHAPRCLQAQLAVREKGLVDRGQIWTVAADDMCFEGTTALTTLILEKPHRGDDPMSGFEPSAPEVLRKYLKLPPAQKKKFLNLTDDFLNNITRLQ